MNVLAGVALGWLGGTWTWAALAGASVLWGVVFCVWQALAVVLGVGQAPHYFAHAREGAKRGRASVFVGFFVPAYVSAVVTAFLVAAVVRLIRGEVTG
jgi:hypothetical protein